MKGLQKQIFLIGFMGCGKSTYGKELAQLLQVPFFDLDEEIQAEAGKSIPEIFAEAGEEGFREVESQQLKKFTNQKEAFVLSTGGGTPCFHNNIHLMKQNGLVVYLKASEAILHKRLHHQRKQRPLLSQLTDKELLPYIRKTLQARSGFYNLADIVIDPIHFTSKNFCELFLTPK